MFKRKRYKRTLDDIGKKRYEFDFCLEKDIYKYLWCSYMKAKNKRKLDKKLKFTTYLMWKKYIYDKYMDYDVTDKIEFSRYLSQRIRNLIPGHESQSIVLPILMSIFLTAIFGRAVEFDYTMILQR